MVKKYDKLVRDHIPEIIKKERGEHCVFRVAGEDEYWRRLKDKLREEVEEFCDSEDPEELADIEEVLSAIRKFRQVDPDAIEQLRRDKVARRGGFERRIILEEA